MPTATDSGTDSLGAELAAAARLDMRANPFVAALVDGRCPPDAIRRYGVAVFALSEGFPQRLAAAVSICDDPVVRLALLENLLEEDGIVAYSGGQLITDVSKRHGNVARRFALAAGATDDELRSAAGSMTRQRMWLSDAIAARRPAAVVAYLMIGIESNVPETLTLTAEALSRHYGFSDGALEFLTSHVAFDVVHGAMGARIVGRLVRSDADRADALDGARRGALAWWWLHRSLLSQGR